MTTDVSPKFLFIVARQLPTVYEHLREQFSAEPSVVVLYDRRMRERRRPDGSAASAEGERREGDRRRNTTVDEQLRVMGYAFVRVDT